MKTRLFFFSFIPTLVILFGLNGVFHSGICDSFFDSQLAHFGDAIKPMRHGSFLPLFVLECILVAVMTYLIIQPFPSNVNPRHALLTGALLSLVSSGTWNLANASMFTWPFQLIIVDMVWHCLLGILGGLLISCIYNQVSGKVPA